MRPRPSGAEHPLITSREESTLGYEIEGDYFETCTCAVSCPCIFLAPATEEACDVFFVWHISKGKKDGTVLDGLNVLMAVHSPKQMTDGGWKAVVYLDQRATPEQVDGLTAIFTGQAGGHLAKVAPLIGSVEGVKSAPTSFTRSGNRWSASAGEALKMEVEETRGMDDQKPTVITNPPLGAVTQPIRQARSGDVRYHDVWRAAFSGRNGFVTEFRYSA